MRSPRFTITRSVRLQPDHRVFQTVPEASEPQSSGVRSRRVSRHSPAIEVQAIAPGTAELLTVASTGYVLIEMLVSTAITCAMVGVLLQFAVGAQRSVRAQGDAADLQQRLRVATDRIRHDLLSAGAGPARGPGRGPLIRVFAPVLPARTGLTRADAELSYHADRITIVFVPDTQSQTALLGEMAGPGAPLLIDAGAPGCASGGACGFTAGDRALIFAAGDAGGAYDVFTVAAAEPGGVLAPAAPLSRGYPAGSPVVAIVQRVYYLDRAGKRLMVYDGNDSDLPLVDHVTDLQFTYYADPAPDSIAPPPAGRSSCAYTPADPPVPLLQDLGAGALRVLTPDRLRGDPLCGQPPNRFDADLLRVRRIGVTVRLETGSAEFGTPPAALSQGSPAVAHTQITFDVAPRNMAGRQ